MSQEEPVSKKQKTTTATPWILNFFEALTPVLHAPGQWTRPEDQSRDYYKPEYWIKIAQLAEKAKFHGLFFGDSLAIYGGYKGPYNFEEAAKSGDNFPKNDPTAYVGAMAISTTNLSFGVTCSTLTEHPYHFARRAATLDHISNGRFGWNVVTSFLPSAGRQLAADGELPDKNERYEKADEYLQVVYELLLSSWRDDGVVYDKERGIFSNPDAIREINFEGRHYRVPGPQITEPSRQRMPMIIQAGNSPKGRLLGAKHAELVYLSGESPEEAGNIAKDIRRLAKEKYGRDPKNIKFITRALIILGKTHEEAIENWETFQKYTDADGVQVQIGGRGLDLSKYEWDEDLRNHPEAIPHIKSYIRANEGKPITRRLMVSTPPRGAFIGSPEEIADQLEEFARISGTDGFNMTNTVFPTSFEDIVNLLVPELQKRGLAQTEYAVPGGTYREQVYRQKGHNFVPEDHYAYPLRWQSGVSKEDFEKQYESYKQTIEGFRITKD